MRRSPALCVPDRIGPRATAGSRARRPRACATSASRRPWATWHDRRRPDRL